MIVIAHNIRSLHNVGAIFRNAAAFGVETLYLTGITATPPRKEIAKVALGAQDLVDWEQGDVAHVIDTLRQDGYRVFGLEAGEDAIPIEDFARECAPSGSPITGGGTPRSSIYHGSRKEKRRLRGSLDLKSIAQEMRRDPTPAERELWQYLRRKQVLGYKFRRQHGIGPFIVDFYCDRARLIIEVDGDIHDESENVKRDAFRQQMLEDIGYTVIRFRNKEVLTDPDAVIARITMCLPSSYGGAGGGEFHGRNIALVLGNEVDGIDADVLELLDGLVEIPMDKKRSLNVSVASGVAMYAFGVRS